MRLRNILAATAASALIIGAVGTPAHSVTAPSPDKAGSVAAWGNQANTNAAEAMAVPDNLGLVESVAANSRATGVVTLDGAVQVWGQSTAPEVIGTPIITDAMAIAFSISSAAALHNDGRVTAWGSFDALNAVPSDLRAKAIALQAGTGYAVREDGTLTTWGEAPVYPVPAGLTNLVDVSTSLTHTLALHSDGTITTWTYTDDPNYYDLYAIPDFGGKKVIKISTGSGFSGAVLEDGSLKIWGVPGAVPAGAPDFDGLTPATKVVDLGLDRNAAAVTADGVVHVWGSNVPMTTVPAALTGEPVSAVAVGQQHVAVVVTAFRDVTQPVVTGTPTVGQTLTATPATLSLTPDSPATGQWYADDAPIAAKTATTLTLDAAMVGKSITYKTTATRDGDTITSGSTPTGPVAKVASSVRVTASPASAAAGSKRTVTATVSSTGGTRTGSVTFKVGTKTATVALSAGKATWTLPALAVGRHNVTAAYNGDSATAASTSASTLSVTKARSKVSGKVKVTGKTVKVAQKVTIALTVTSAKGVSHAGKLTLALKGATKKTVVARVNAAGNAVVTIKNVKRGQYTAQLAYVGNSNISAAKGSVKFTV